MDLEKLAAMDEECERDIAQSASQPVRGKGLYTAFVKRLFDLGFVLLSAPFVLPVVVILALLVARDGASPFFGHKRVGKDGKVFRCWKIRSMVPDAEARLAKHLAENPAARAEWDRDFKLENDPRITRLGHFLRRSSLDELPQFWNILRGEMSVVGPRPVTATEVERYGAAKNTYKAMLPGLTGLWQVSGRNDLTYPQRVAMDVDYFGRISYTLDTVIIAKTVLAVMRRTGR